MFNQEFLSQGCH